jgi:cytoskeletal protein RodZ
LIPHDDDAGKDHRLGFKEGEAEKLLLAAFRQFPLRKMPKQTAPARDPPGKTTTTTTNATTTKTTTSSSSSSGSSSHTTSAPTTTTATATAAGTTGTKTETSTACHHDLPEGTSPESQ